jgi:hypothetical protein
MQHCKCLDLQCALALFDLQQQLDDQTTLVIVPRAGLEHAEEEGRTHHATCCCNTLGTSN